MDPSWRAPKGRGHPAAPASRVDQGEDRRRLTLEALADVDADHVIDHQSVQAWADNLDSDTPLLVPR